MSVVNLGTGPPFRGSLINTNPKQFRFIQKADQDYKIRINYIAIPTAITSNTQNLDLPDQHHELMYLKFVEKVALSLGQTDLSILYRRLYEAKMLDEKFLASSKHLVHQRLKFSWL